MLLDPSVHIKSLSHPNFKIRELSQQTNTHDCLSFHPFPITNRVSGPKVNNQKAEPFNKQGAVIENAYFVGGTLLKRTSNNVTTVSYCDTAQLPRLSQSLCTMTACCYTPLRNIHELQIQLHYNTLLLLTSYPNLFICNLAYHIRQI